jgi:hypothetical protein
LCQKWGKWLNLGWQNEGGGKVRLGQVEDSSGKMAATAFRAFQFKVAKIDWSPREFLEEIDMWIKSWFWSWILDQLINSLNS